MIKVTTKTVRKIVRDEIRDMRKQIKEKPYAEPEPNAYRFDRMTQEERHYVATQLGL